MNLLLLIYQTSLFQTNLIRLNLYNLNKNLNYIAFITYISPIISRFSKHYLITTETQQADNPPGIRVTDVMCFYVISNVCEKSLSLCCKISPFSRNDSDLQNIKSPFAEL